MKLTATAPATPRNDDIFGSRRRVISVAIPRLIFALLLIAAQALILGLGLFAPQVSSDYRAYFIEHSIHAWPGSSG